MKQVVWEFNCYDPKKPYNCPPIPVKPLSDADREALKDKHIGEPKATEMLSVEKLKQMNVVGVYRWVDVGPSVHEAAEALIRTNRAKISDLQDEIAAANYRLRRQAYANMLESERIANESEPFQRTQTPTCEADRFQLDNGRYP